MRISFLKRTNHLDTWLLAVIFFCAFLLSIPSSAYALSACDGTTNGNVELDVDELKFCDGTDWVPLGYTQEEGAASLWTRTTNENGIYYNSNNVGVGESDPSTTLHVSGSIDVTGPLIADGAVVGAQGMLLNDSVADIECLGEADFGRLRFNTTSDKIEVCAGYRWIDSAGPKWSDNLIGEQALLEPSVTEAEAYFGASVSISGDTALVGAPGEDHGNDDRGSAYVFVRASDGTWSEEQRLTASDEADYDYFGNEVIVKGDWAFVGGSNAVYFFTRAGAVWSEQQKIEISGRALFLTSYNELLIGDDTDSANTGIVYAFTYSGGTWTEQQTITASDAAVSTNFGGSIHGYLDKIIIGAKNEDTSAADSGAVYVFQKQSGTWTQIQKIKSGSIEAGALFGETVKLNGNDLFISSIFEDDAIANKGYVYHYLWDGVQYNFVTKMNDGNNTSADKRNYGTSVSPISSNLILVGRDSLIVAEERVFLMQRTGGTWSVLERIYPSETNTEHFGSVSAIDGNSYIVGANASSKNAVEGGLAFVYTNYASTGNPWIYGAQFEDKLEPPVSAGDFLGSDNAIALEDDQLVIGTYNNDTGGSQRGAVATYRDIAGTWTYQAMAQHSGLADNDGFGYKIDINNGKSIIGTNAGTDAHIINDPANAFTEEETFTGSDISFGDAVTIHGNYAVVGQSDNDDQDTNAGAAFVYLYEDNVWSLIQTLYAETPTTNGGFGIAMDMNDETLVIGQEGNKNVNLFQRIGNQWHYSQTLTPGSGSSTNSFGSSYIKVHKDLVLVRDGANAAAQLSIFKRTGNSWAEIQTIATALSFDIHGDTLVTGEVTSASIYIRNNDSFTQVQQFVPADFVGGDNFGAAVAIYDGYIVIASSGHDSIASNGGAAYVLTPR